MAFGVILGSFALAHGEISPLSFDVAYPQASTPGERISVEILGDRLGQADVLRCGRLEVALGGEKVMDLVIPEDAAPGSNLPMSLKTKDGIEHLLPALAVVPESSSFGRDRLITRQPPLANGNPAPAVLPLRVGGDFCINGFNAIHSGPCFNGPWPSEGCFFLRTVDHSGRYSAPFWFRPVVSRDETLADFGFGSEGPQLVDRWRRHALLPVEGAVKIQAGLPVLVGPVRKPINFTVNDLPAGPLTLSFWLRPGPASKLQVIRASGILAVGIDDSGCYFAKRSDDSRNPRIATSAVKAADRWQHVAAIFNGVAVLLYVDGQQAAMEACDGRKSATRDRCENLGSEDGGKNPFVGQIGAYAVYNRALPLETVRELSEAFHNSESASLVKLALP